MRLSHSPRRRLLGIVLFWMVVAGAVSGRIAYFDEIAASAQTERLP